MLNPQFKSKTKKLFLSVQTIALIKKVISTYLIKKAQTTFQFQVAQPMSKMISFEKKRSIKFYQILPVIVATLFIVSCQKEALTDPALNATTSDDLLASAAGTTGPTVDAGPTVREVYSTTGKSSTNSATLRGSVSSTSVSVKWKQISGVSTATIEKPTSVNTTVSNLKPGVYFFVLTATNSKGVSSTDTTSISVFQLMTWKIEGVTREAWVHPSSSKSGKVPVIFVYHGHKSSDHVMAENGFELEWPEAIVVYPQGLVRNDSETGWQGSVGEKNNKTGVKDDDLKLFDAMRSTFINNYNADPSKMFAHGWSNGGRFIINVLWEARGDKLAGLSPASTTVKSTSGKRTIPIIHVAGKSDDKVPFSAQQKSSERERTLNQCSSNSFVWATGPKGILGTKYPSPIHNPVVFLQYNGEHRYPVTVVPNIVQFFKEVQ